MNDAKGPLDGNCGQVGMAGRRGSLGACPRGLYLALTLLSSSLLPGCRDLSSSPWPHPSTMALQPRRWPMMDQILWDHELKYIFLLWVILVRYFDHSTKRIWQNDRIRTSTLFLYDCLGTKKGKTGGRGQRKKRGKSRVMVGSRRGRRDGGGRGRKKEN